MNTNIKLSTKVFTFLFIVFLCSLSSGKIYAQGPTAPEAASFEPVDATDMVNLITGDMSYVIPILNVPSPEGGYPLALAYHAGIAMDQESSWVGLGWNINPGAINRTVNGYPDDWKTAHMREIFYDEGGSEEFNSFSVGFGLPNQGSIGLGISWGSDRAFGGQVEIGYAGGSVGFGTEAVSFGIGQSGFSSLGVSIGFNGSVGLQYTSANKTSIGGQLGLSVGYGKNGLSGGASFTAGEWVHTRNAFGTIISRNYNTYGSVGFSLSSKSVSINGNLAGFGTGFSYAFDQSINSDSYTTRESLSMYSIATPWFYVSFSKRKFEWHLDEAKYNTLDGLMYDKQSHYPTFLYSMSDGASTGTVYPKSYPQKYDNYELYTENVQTVDYEKLVTDYNHALFPNRDNYSVNAQGLGGSISPIKTSNYGISHDNLIIFLKPDRKNIYMFDKTPIIDNNIPAQFYFENDHSSFLRTLPSKFNYMSNVSELSFDNYIAGIDNDAYINNLPQDYFFTTNNDRIFHSTNNNNSFNTQNGRLKKGSYIEYFTNKQIRENTITGFMEAKGIDRSDKDIFLDDGIGAYRITTVDGKTYHYSLPVYQFEKIMRSYNLVENKSELNAHFDKVYRDSYATHWLLTAVTGPDYIKKSPSSISYPDSNESENYSDYGYWVRFDYGKWSDGYLWKTPYGKHHDETVTENDKIIKSYQWGRKQLYYLDAVKTRTHTALFIKDVKEDAQSTYINYSNMYHQRSNEIKRVNVPALKQLRLNNILLLKNEHAETVNKENLISDLSESKVNYDYQYLASTRYGTVAPYTGGATNVNFFANIQENVLDVGDIEQQLYSNAINIVDFNYDYSLASNAPNTSKGGKLTLKSLSNKGKSGVQLLPPYKFNYIKEINDFLYGFDITIKNDLNIEDKDNWGYRKNYPMMWSLNEISTPIGTKIKIEYESDDFHRQAVGTRKIFDRGVKFLVTAVNRNSDIYLEMNNDLSNYTNFSLHFNLNDPVDITNFFICRREKYCQGIFDCHRREVKLHIEGAIAEVIEVTNDKVKLKIPANSNYWSFDDQNEFWILNRIWSKQGVQHASGSPDGVIMRDPGRNLCYTWRDSYDKSDGSFYYSLTSNTPLIDQKEGGVRVKSLEVTDEVNHFYTNYYYNVLGFDKNVEDANYRSSGITSFTPVTIDEMAFIPYVSEMPSPNVYYNNVTAEKLDNNGNLNNKTNYKFKTFTPKADNNILVGDVFELSTEKDSYTNTINNVPVEVKKIIVKDALGSIGQLLSKIDYNSENQILSKIVNKYKDQQDFSQGVFQESYYSAKRIEDYSEANIDKWVLNTSTRFKYPSVLESSTVTQGGISSTTYFDQHDFNTGQLLQTRTFASDGTIIKTKTIPAYYKYPIMGSKVDDITNKNMLSQQAANYTYLLDETTNEEEVIHVDITTWNNDWVYRDNSGTETSPITNNEKIWRKHKTYVWEGDIDPLNGTYVGYDNNIDDNFDWGLGATQTNSKWKNVSTTTRYDHYSAPLETKDINGNYAAIKMGDKDSKIMAVANAQFTEMFYSGCEYVDNVYEGEIFHVGVNTIKAHTGIHSVKVIPGGSAFYVYLKANEHRPGKYKISVWAGRDNYLSARLMVLNNGRIQTKEFNGEKIFAGDWVQLNHYEDLGAGQVSVWVRTDSGEIYYDDFRMHPIASSMTSYVYNEWDELWCLIGSNGLATKFEYDSAGRIIKTYTEIVDNDGVTGGFKLVSENNYNYKKTQ